jgi:hypothetical protein
LYVGVRTWIVKNGFKSEDRAYTLMLKTPLQSFVMGKGLGKYRRSLDFLQPFFKTKTKEHFFSGLIKKIDRKIYFVGYTKKTNMNSRLNIVNDRRKILSLFRQGNIAHLTMKQVCEYVSNLAYYHGRAK